MMQEEEHETFYVGVCPTCWMSFGRDATKGSVPECATCPVCGDAVYLIFTPEAGMVPFIRRTLALQERRMRDVYAAMQYALIVRGPAYVKRGRVAEPLQIMQRWDTNVAEFWPAVGRLLADELVARVSSASSSEEETA